MSEISTWRDQVSSDIGQIKGTVDGLARSHEELKDRLMGNGQPGIIHHMYGQLRHLWRLVWIGYGIALGVLGAAALLGMVHEGQSTLLAEILKVLAK